MMKAYNSFCCTPSSMQHSTLPSHYYGYFLIAKSCRNPAQTLLKALCQNLKKPLCCFAMFLHQPACDEAPCRMPLLFQCASFLYITKFRRSSSFSLQTATRPPGQLFSLIANKAYIHHPFVEKEDKQQPGIAEHRNNGHRRQEIAKGTKEQHGEPVE